MAKPKAYVMLATPSYTGTVCVEYSSALCLAGAHCALQNIWLEPRTAAGFSLVEYARNWLVAEFLSKPYTHLFWIDDDLGFTPDSIAKLVNRNLDVVCGIYTTKNENNPIYPYTALGPVVKGLQLAERVPGGFMCMKRHVIEKCVKDCEWYEIDHDGTSRLSPWFFDLRPYGKHKVGEDYIACERIRAAGFKIYVETDLNFKHWGRKAWGGNLSETLKEEAKAGFEGQNTPEAWEKNQKIAENPELIAAYGN